MAYWFTDTHRVKHRTISTTQCIKVTKLSVETVQRVTTFKLLRDNVSTYLK